MKNTIQIYRELEKISLPLIKNFVEDLTQHDLISIERNPGLNFIHTTRESGTSIHFFKGPEVYPVKNLKIPYLFGSANREDIVKGALITLDHYLKNDPKIILFYDASKGEFKEINKYEARQKLLDHYLPILEAWDLENICA